MSFAWDLYTFMVSHKAHTIVQSSKHYILSFVRVTECLASEQEPKAVVTLHTPPPYEPLSMRKLSVAKIWGNGVVAGIDGRLRLPKAIARLLYKILISHPMAYTDPVLCTLERQDDAPNEGRGGQSITHLGNTLATYVHLLTPSSTHPMKSYGSSSITKSMTSPTSRTRTPADPSSCYRWRAKMLLKRSSTFTGMRCCSNTRICA